MRPLGWALGIVLGLAASIAHARLMVGPFLLEGRLEQGGLLIGQAPPGALAVALDNEPVVLGKDGRFLIALGRDAGPVALLSATLPTGEDIVQPLDIAARSYVIQRIGQVPKQTVEVPPQWWARREGELGQIGAARLISRADADWEGGFIWPARGRITGVYGSQRFYNGSPGAPHWGVDIAAPVGTPVVAPAPGVVTLAATNFLMEGGLVIIDHGYGLSSNLLHLSAVDVTLGQKVVAGQRIGAIGATGRATGPHVDWRLNYGAIRVDPQLLPGLAVFKP